MTPVVRIPWRLWILRNRSCCTIEPLYIPRNVQTRVYLCLQAWTAPEVVPGTRESSFSTQNPVLFHDARNSTLWLFATRQPSTKKASAYTNDPVPSQETKGQLWAMSTPTGVDNKWQWSPPFVLDGSNGTWGRNPPLVRLDGSWLLPMYNESLKSMGHNYEHSMLFLKPLDALLLPFTAGDQGPPVGWREVDMTASSYLVQPSLVRLQPGQPALRAFFRDRRAAFIYTSTSPDDGLTWTTPVATSLPNNNAGIHASRLRNGSLLLVFNLMHGETKDDLRNILAAAVSDDGGETFGPPRLLERHHSSAEGVGGLGPTSCNCYSYPTSVQVFN